MSGLNITAVDIRLNPDSKGPVLAFVNFTIGGEFVIENAKIIRGKNGQEFVAMPQRKGKDKDGKDAWFDVAHPISANGRKIVSDAVMAAWAQKKEEEGILG